MDETFPKTPPENLRFIRFVRKPFSGNDMEVEYVCGEERQGQITDVDTFVIETWMELHGFRYTENLRLAVTSAWNFGEAAYIPKTDSVVPL